MHLIHRQRPASQRLRVKLVCPFVGSVRWLLAVKKLSFWRLNTTATGTEGKSHHLGPEGWHIRLRRVEVLHGAIATRMDPRRRIRRLLARLHHAAFPSQGSSQTPRPPEHLGDPPAVGFCVSRLGVISACGGAVGLLACVVGLTNGSSSTSFGSGGTGTGSGRSRVFRRADGGRVRPVPAERCKAEGVVNSSCSGRRSDAVIAVV